MKKNILLLTGALLALFLFAQAMSNRGEILSRQQLTTVQEVPPNKAFSSLKEARTLIEEMVMEEDIVGLAISISLGDSLIWSEGFGHSDLEQQTAISPSETHFRIASISKPITATILGRLHEEEILDVDQSLYSYVPDFPKKKYDFTLRQLAMHRAGIRHYKRFEGENTKPLSIEEGLQKFRKSKLRFEPGTEYLYSSYGYNLLGVAMEKAAGKPFEQLMAEYVTAPLQLSHTLADDAQYKGIQTSGFFTSNGKGRVKQAEKVNMYMKLPCGGMLSTSEDLVSFGNAYIYQRILKEQTQTDLLNDSPLPNGETTGYGMGWGVSTDKKGRFLISHTGGNTGSVCRLVVYPEQQLSIAIVSNTFGIDWLKFIRNTSKISNGLLADLDQ